MNTQSFIGAFEGCHLVRPNGMVWPYICPAGYWTQGWGRLVFAGASPQTRGTVDEWFTHDINRHQNYLYTLSPRVRKSSEGRITALSSWVYNLGPTRYQLSTLRKVVNAGNWEAAIREIVKWIYGGGKKLPGLVIRRNAEAQLLLRG